VQQVGIKYYICKRSAGLGRTLQNTVYDTPQMIMPVNKASSVLQTYGKQIMNKKSNVICIEKISYVFCLLDSMVITIKNLQTVRGV
jgi:hypothetical protein